MNDEKTNKIMSSEELDDLLPKYEPIKLSGKNLAQNYVSAFNTGMNIYQCINYLQGNVDWTINAVNDVVKSWNTEVSESIDQSKAIVRETTTEQFNIEWTNKQPELIEQVNTLTTNQFNNEKSIFNDELNALNARIDSFSNPNLLINPDFKINQRGATSYEKQGYSVDRWKIWNVTVTPNTNGGITIKSDKYDDNGNILQYLENATEGDSTLSCYVTSVSGKVEMVASDDSKVVLKQGLNVVHTSASTRAFTIFLHLGASITLKWVKLEQGKVATPFVSPNPAEEYLKCERFYQRVSIDLNPISLNNSQGFVPLKLETAFRNTPTVSYLTNKIAVKKTYIDMTVEVLQFNRAWMSGSNVLAFEFTTDNNRISLIINNGQGIGDIALDAEIY